MSSATNTSLRKAIDELGQALEVCFGDGHQSKEAITRLKETIKSIENRLDVLSVTADEMIGAAATASDQSFAPEVITGAEKSGIKPSNAVASPVLSVPS